MHIASSTDLAIAVAGRNGTLRIVERASRLGGTFFSIEDAVGVIETHFTRGEVDQRIDAIRARAV